MESSDKDESVRQFLAQHRLAYNPFSSERVEGLFFPGGQRQQALDQITHLLNYSDLILAVLGREGIGKTSQFCAFSAQLQTTSHLCVLDAAAILSQGQLVGEIITQWQVSTDAATLDDKISALSRYAEMEQSRNMACVILVDDAHQLSSEVLQLLVALSCPVGSVVKSIRLILFGDKLLEAHLHDEHIQSLDSNVHIITLEPLLPDETAEYIYYRLATAGYAGEPLLNTQQVMKVHNKSQGIPADINHYVTKAMEDMAKVQQVRARTSFKKEPLPYAHIAAVVVIGAAVLLSLFYGDNSEKRDTESLNVVELVAKEDPTIVDVRRKISQELEARNLDEQSMKAQTDEKKPVLIGQELDAKNDKNKVGNGKKLKVEAVGVAEKRTSNITVKDAVSNVEEKVIGKVKPKIAVAKEKVQPYLNTVIAVEGKTATVEVTEFNADVVAETKSDDKVKQSQYRREQWLLGLNSRHYTLQVLGTYSERKAVDFIESQKNSRAFAYFKTSYKSQGWYVVLYGEYPDRPAALAAVPRLEQKLRKLKPWSRSLLSVQQDIRKQEPR